MKLAKGLLLAAVAGWMLVAPALGAPPVTLATWSLVNTLTGTTIVPDALSVGDITAGNGVGTLSLSAKGYSGQGWNSASRNEDAYFEFSVTAVTNWSFSPGELSMNFRSTKTGPAKAEVRWSLDGSAWTTAGTMDVPLDGNDRGHPFTVDFTGVTVGSGETFAIRIYAWGASANTGTFRIGNAYAMTLSGSVARRKMVTATVANPARSFAEDEMNEQEVVTFGFGEEGFSMPNGELGGYLFLVPRNDSSSNLVYSADFGEDWESGVFVISGDQGTEPFSMFLLDNNRTPAERMGYDIVVRSAETWDEGYTVDTWSSQGFDFTVTNVVPTVTRAFMGGSEVNESGGQMAGRALAGVPQVFKAETSEPSGLDLYSDSENGYVDSSKAFVTKWAFALDGDRREFAVKGPPGVTALTHAFDRAGVWTATVSMRDKDMVSDGQETWGPEFPFTVVVDAPPSVSNVVARQRWPWNGLVDVDYEVGGNTENLMARISFSASDGRSWVATNFLAGTKPSAEPGPHRATWDTKADGVADVVAESVVATVELASRAVSLSLVHTVTLAAAPASCRAVVAYDSTEGTGLRAVVDAVDFDNAAGTARFKVLLEGEDAQIRSITLFSGTGAAFEWFDFAVPRAVAPGESVVADIRENRPYLSGSGTASDPYLIANPAQLDRVRETASDGAFYRLVKDIDFQGSCGIRITKGDGGAVLEVVDGNARFYATDADYIRGWLPIGVYSVNAMSGEESNCEGSYFKGHFDGGGFLVDNLCIWADKTYGGTSIKGDQGLTVGLFGQCVSATIANVRIGGHSAIHAYTDKNLSVGAVVGGSMNKREHLFGYAKNTGDENRLRTFVTGCSSAAYIDSHGYFSSVTGGVGGCMEDCIASGCSNFGEIVVHAGLEKAMYAAVGGCFGEIYNSRCITDADSWSDETQQPVVMGNLSNEGAITVVSDRLEGWPCDYVGGIVGYGYHVSLDGATNTANVTFSEEVETTKSRTVYLSGVAGCMEGLSSDTLQLNNLSNTGDITATMKSYSFCYAGGIAGQIPDVRSSLNRCSNSGQVSATNGDWQNAGGIAGYSSGGEYVGCVNVGEVRVYGSKDDSYDYIGGIAGYLECDYETSLSECFNMGTVSGTVVKLAGGIAGGYCDLAACTIKGCLACGDFNVDATPGGILGKVSNDRLTTGHNAFLAGTAATDASPGGNGVWADTLAIADGAVLACEAEAADGKRLHEFLNLDDESFDWVKSTAAEGVPAGYPVPAWYDK